MTGIKFFLSRKILVVLLVPLIFLSFLAFSVEADTDGQTPLLSRAAWTYDGYKVERLSADFRDKNMIHVGDRVVFFDTSSCQELSCTSDIFSIKYGMGRNIEDVPRVLLDTKRFEKNNGRLLALQTTREDENYFMLSEYDFANGQITPLLKKEVFFSGTNSLDVLIDEEENIFFNQEFDYQNSKAYKQAAVWVWDYSGREADIIVSEGTRRREELLDVQEGLALVKMVFESGQEQLWIYDGKHYTATAIPGTWTEPHGDIQAAHFREDGSVEFFQYFRHYLYDTEQNPKPIEQENYLNWYHPIAKSVQINGEIMAWVNPDDILFVSTQGKIHSLGTATNGEFLLTQDAVYFVSGSKTIQSVFLTGKNTEIPFNVTDVYKNWVVGTDKQGAIFYMNTVTEKVLTVGYGTTPLLSDENHLYWKGQDNNYYEATVLPSSQSTVASARVIQEHGSSQMFLFLNEEILFQLNEQESLLDSWFPRGYKIESVVSGYTNGFLDGGQAPYAPGTRIKLKGDPKIYLVGFDGQLHWMTTEKVAQDIMGNQWNKHVKEITQEDLTHLQMGKPLISERDLE